MFGFVFRLIGRMIGFVVKAAVFVAALAVVAAGTMYALFDAEQYKRVVTQRVVDVTGRALSINGPVELELGFPPRVTLNDVRLKNARWGSRADMARVKRVQIKLDPLRAVAGESGATDLRLEGVDLLLETGTGGVGNWEFGPLATGAGAVGMGALAVMQLLAPALPGASISIADAIVSFRDGATGRSQVVNLGVATTLELATPGAAGAAPTGAMAVAQVTAASNDPCEKEGEELKLAR